MKARALGLNGLMMIDLTVHQDDRGSFRETYSREKFAEMGITCEFVQDNGSRSFKNTLRGLHYQSEPGQAKLIAVMTGRIWDVVVDIRPDSPTFGRWEGHEMDGKSQRLLYVPVGFAHGFCVMSNTAEVAYKVSSPYRPATECSLRWDDPDIGIEWPILLPILSEKDAQAESFASFRKRLGR